MSAEESRGRPATAADTGARESGPNPLDSALQIPGGDDRTMRAEVLEAWKTTVDVQKHFNELEMKVRNFALTLMTAALAGAAFGIKERVRLVTTQFDVPLASVILVAAIPIWLCFFLMDRFWYHRLLLGAVKHGLFIENSVKKAFPELGLATRIGEESPVHVRSTGWRIRSTHRIDIFYGTVACFLVVASVGAYFIRPEPTSHSQQPVAAEAAVDRPASD